MAGLVFRVATNYKKKTKSGQLPRDNNDSAIVKLITTHTKTSWQ